MSTALSIIVVLVFVALLVLSVSLTMRMAARKLDRECFHSTPAAPVHRMSVRRAR